MTIDEYLEIERQRGKFISGGGCVDFSCSHVVDFANVNLNPQTNTRGQADLV